MTRPGPGGPGRAFKAFVLLLAGLLVFEPTVLLAQSRRNRDGSSDRGTFKRPGVESLMGQGQGDQQGSGMDQLSIDVGSIGKVAYDAIIRSGRYIVGSGDVFAVLVYGEHDVNVHQTLVTAEGELIIPFVGSIPVAGLTLSQANARIEEAISGSVRMRIDVNLSRLKSFPVNVIGNVNWPGAYQVKGVEQVSELIIKAGGLVDDGRSRASHRNIRILRIDDTGDFLPTDRKADLRLWTINGDVRHNPFLLDGDQIQVPVMGDSVSVSGAIRKSGFYEYAPGDRVADLIHLGGGLIGAPDGVVAELLRLSASGGDELRIPIVIDEAINGDTSRNILLQPGDKLHLEGQDARITIQGEVRFPGAYPIREGAKLRDVIQRAGGFTDEASLAQAVVIRKLEAPEKVDLDEDIGLKRLINTPRSQLTDKEMALVTLRTQRAPGRLPIDFTALFEKGVEEHNIVLKDEDVIRVPRFTASVMVNGAVLAPAAIPFNESYAVHDYIERAGGFSPRAKKGDIVIVQGRSGNAVELAKVPRIEPGDAIYVPEKLPGQGWRIFRESLTILTNVATLILIIQNTRR